MKLIYYYQLLSYFVFVLGFTEEFPSINYGFTISSIPGTNLTFNSTKHIILEPVPKHKPTKLHNTLESLHSVNNEHVPTIIAHLIPAISPNHVPLLLPHAIQNTKSEDIPQLINSVNTHLRPRPVIPNESESNKATTKNTGKKSVPLLENYFRPTSLNSNNKSNIKTNNKPNIRTNKIHNTDNSSENFIETKFNYSVESVINMNFNNIYVEDFNETIILFALCKTLNLDVQLSQLFITNMDGGLRIAYVISMPEHNIIRRSLATEKLNVTMILRTFVISTLSDEDCVKQFDQKIYHFFDQDILHHNIIQSSIDYNVLGMDKILINNLEVNSTIILRALYNIEEDIEGFTEYTNYNLYISSIIIYYTIVISLGILCFSFTTNTPKPKIQNNHLIKKNNDIIFYQTIC